MKEKTYPSLEDWQLEEIEYTLHIARNAILGLTALDSNYEIEKKTRENECAVTRAIDNCLKWFK